MAHPRRTFFQASLALLLTVVSGRSWPKLPADDLQTALRQASGGHPVTASDAITLEVPDIAENGAIVPVTVDSRLPGVQSIWVFVEKNPVTLAAHFDFDESLDPFLSLRVKMNESCDIVVLVKAGEGYFSARKAVRVMLGGCG